MNKLFLKHVNTFLTERELTPMAEATWGEIREGALANTGNYAAAIRHLREFTSVDTTEFVEVSDSITRSATCWGQYVMTHRTQRKVRRMLPLHEAKRIIDMLIENENVFGRDDGGEM